MAKLSKLVSIQGIILYNISEAISSKMIKHLLKPVFLSNVNAFIAVDMYIIAIKRCFMSHSYCYKKCSLK